MLADTSYLTTSEAAPLLGVCPITVARMIDRGDLRGYHVGVHRRTTKADVDAYIHRGTARYCTVAEVEAIVERRLAAWQVEWLRTQRQQREAEEDARRFAAKWQRKAK